MQKALSLSQAAATGEHVTLGLRVESLRLPVPRLSSADDHTLSWPRKVQTRSYKRPSQPVACRSGAGMGEKYIGCEMWTMLTAILIFNHLVLVLPSSKEEEQRSGSAPLSPPLSREIKRFESLIDQDPKNISLKYTVGLLYQLAGRPQEVCDYLYSAYRMDPDRASPELFFHLANNLKAIGETEAAVNFYALAIGASPIGPVNWVLMAIALDFLGHPDLALKGYQALSQFLNTKFCKGRGKQQRTVPGEIQESDRLGRQRVGERDGTDRVRGICHGKFFREFGRANVCKRAPCRLTSIPSLPQCEPVSVSDLVQKLADRDTVLVALKAIVSIARLGAHNHADIVAAGAISPLVALLGTQSTEAVQELAAVALSCLAVTVDNRVKIAAAGVIPPLAILLGDQSLAALQAQAAQLLANIA